MTKECPICLETKDVESGFGYRNKPEGRRPQTWCRSCRSTGKIKSYIEREQKEAPEVSLARDTAMFPVFSGVIDTEPRNVKEVRIRSITVERTDLQTWLRRIYQETYPGDKAGDKRSINFMKAKLTKKGVLR